MNEDKIFYVKYAIVLFRIIYIFLAFLSIVFIIDGEHYIEAIIIGLLCVVVITMNIFLKLHKKKLEKVVEHENVEYQTLKQAEHEKRQQICDKLNKNMQIEVDESRIKYTVNDEKRSEKNCEIMKKNGLPYTEQMRLIPLELFVNIKSKEEIAKQMIEEYFLSRKAYNKVQGISDMQDQKLIPDVLKYGVIKDKTIREIFTQISQGEIDTLTLNNLCYLLERANVYMWILGLIDKQPQPNEKCSIGMVTTIIEKYENIEDLINNCKMKSNEEILEYADLITRYEGAMFELKKVGKESKKINKDSLMEQKKAINWVTSFNPYDFIKLK